MPDVPLGIPKLRSEKYYSNLKSAGLLHGTIKDAVAKRKARNANPPEEQGRVSLKRWPLKAYLQASHLKSDPIREQYRELQDQHPRKKNWYGVTETCCITDREMVCVSTERSTHRRYSKGWYSYTARVRSFCCVSSSGKYILWFIGNQHGKMVAPRGWVFGTDSIGPYIAKRSDKNERYRYHFSANDVCGGRKAFLDFVVIFRRSVKEKIRLARERQLRQARFPKLVKKAREIGIFVLYRDSRSAGNCAVGTMKWCEEKGLDVRGYAPLELIERFSNDFRVKPVITAAIDRAVTDMERGYCETIYWDLDLLALAKRVCMATEPEEALC